MSETQEITQTILDQLKASRINGLPFFAYTGIKGISRINENTLALLKIPRNPGKIKLIIIKYIPARDTYNLLFFNKLQLTDHPIFNFDDIYFDMLSDIISDKMGIK